MRNQYLKLHPSQQAADEVLDRGAQDHLRDCVILKQAIYVKSINPLKAYALKYKYFETRQHSDSAKSILTEGDLCQELIERQNVAMNIGSKFNKKIQKTIHEVL